VSGIRIFLGPPVILAIVKKKGTNRLGVPAPPVAHLMSGFRRQLGWVREKGRGGIIIHSVDGKKKRKLMVGAAEVERSLAFANESLWLLSSMGGRNWN